VGLNSLKSLNLTNVYPNNKKSNNNKVKSKPLELYEFAGKNQVGQYVMHDHYVMTFFLVVAE
jgi:hypothetical protein